MTPPALWEPEAFAINCEDAGCGIGETIECMYVDEVGENDSRASSDPNCRFLSLAGVLLGLDYVRAEVQPALESMAA